MAFSRYYSFVASNKPVLRKRSDAAIKRYESADDSRAWSNDKFEKSTFIQDLVKRKTEDSSSDDNELVNRPIEHVSPNDELVKKIKALHEDIKAKDTELDKIHKLFKQASRKLEEMNEIVKDKQEFEKQLKHSKAQLNLLADEKRISDEKIVSMEMAIEETKRNPIEAEESWEKIKSRSDLLDNVANERDVLKKQLCKMLGISEVLRKLKKRADEADWMEQEIVNLKRELERCGYGAAGDAALKNRARSSCEQCRVFADELCRSESMLEAEIQRNVSTEADRNVLRERVRMIDVMQAELICYKAKYEEAERQVMKLKEMLVLAELRGRHDQELRQKLEVAENQTFESERHAQELTNTVELLERELREREVYIDVLTQRLQQGSYSPKKAIAYDDVEPGKVQSIVRQLSHEAAPSNCKCGFDNCQCLVVSRNISVMTRKSDILPSEKSSEDSVRIPAQEVIKSLTMSSSTSKPEFSKSELKVDVDQLSRDISADEIRLLRAQNAELSQHLKCCQEEIEKMKSLMIEVEKQRESNHELERELSEIQSVQSRHSQIQESKFNLMIVEKENELKELQNKLSEAQKKTNELEEKLSASTNIMKDFSASEDRCLELGEKLSRAETDDAERAQELLNLQTTLEQSQQNSLDLMKRIHELEIDLDKQREYSETLAEQLRTRSTQNVKSETAEQKQNLECLRKYIKDFKNHYDNLKLEKIDMIQCYENKLQLLESDNDELKHCLDKAIASKACEWNWNTISDSSDVLLKKSSKFGLHALNRDELVDLHNRVRCAMMKMKISCKDMNNIPIDYYSKMADEIRIKYQLKDLLPSTKDVNDIPEKDDDVCSSKTFPSFVRSISRKSLSKKQRARSTEAENQTSISQKSRKK